MQAGCKRASTAMIKNAFDLNTRFSSSLIFAGRGANLIPSFGSKMTHAFKEILIFDRERPWRFTVR
jgi:hypothetical protein